MANLQKRGGYTPRRAREQRAFRAVQVGSVAGVGTVVTAVLAIAGVLGWGIPVILAILTAVSLWVLRGVTGRR